MEGKLGRGRRGMTAQGETSASRSTALQKSGETSQPAGMTEPRLRRRGVLPAAAAIVTLSTAILAPEIADGTTGGKRSRRLPKPFGW